MSKHTPRPWDADRVKRRKLRAAAPELAAAASAALSLFDEIRTLAGLSDEISPVMDALDAALRKAGVLS